MMTEYPAIFHYTFSSFDVHYVMGCGFDHAHAHICTGVASYPVPFRGGKEKGLVSTVCACARFPWNSREQYSSVIVSVFERAKRGHSLFMSIEISDIYMYIYIYIVILYLIFSL